MNRFVVSFGSIIVFAIIGIFGYGAIASLREAQELRDGRITPPIATATPTVQPPAVFPTAAQREFEEKVGKRPPTNATYKGHFKDFGFEGSCFRFKAGEICGGESNVLHFKAITGAVWATDWHYNYQGKDYLYAARVKESKLCGPYLPDFEEIPSQCIAEEIIVPATQARTWLKKQFGPKLYGDPDIQESLDMDYPLE